MKIGSAIASSSERSPQAAPWVVLTLLWTLTLLFAIRVLGQAAQRWWPQSFLPSFGAFQGSGLQYPLLLSAQLTILALMVRAVLRVRAGTLSPSSGQLKFLIGFGSIYMAGSILRIAIGLAVPAAPHWFTAWIPAFFHLVLAAFVVTLALHARNQVPQSMRNSGASI